ncbi:cation transporter, partial [Rhodococcus erythropolis]
AGGLVLLFNWTWADVVVGVLISLWVVPRAIKLAAASLRILTQASPADVDVEAVEADLAALPSVMGVHDLHVWTLTTGMDVATVHLTSDANSSNVLESARTVLESHGLSHATVQVESCANGEHCEKNVTW